MKLNKRSELTKERLIELFEYDKDTGVFKRKVARGNQSAGTIPGTRNHPTGRTYMHVDGKTYFSYRLAWLYVYGQFPDSEIDHIDGNKKNNSIYNLRQASRHENAQNIKVAHKNNVSGFLGVNKRGSRYRARIRIDGKLINIGQFDTPVEAHDAYMKAKDKLHPGFVRI